MNNGGADKSGSDTKRDHYPKGKERDGERRVFNTKFKPCFNLTDLCFFVHPTCFWGFSLAFAPKECEILFFNFLEQL